MNDPRSRHAADPLRSVYSATHVDIRLASAADKHAALQIDDGYTTGVIWQMQSHLSTMGMALDSVPGGDTAFGVVFLPVRLPRPRRVDGLRTTRSFVQRATSWDASDCVLVLAPRTRGPMPDQFAMFEGAPPAEYQEPAGREIWGYAVANAVPSAGVAWLAELCVTEEHRRHGLGATLLDAVIAWAGAPESLGGAGGMSALMVELSPRNSLAIDFCRARGFSFAGYTDYSSSGGDTTLLFSRSVS